MLLTCYWVVWEGIWFYHISKVTSDAIWDIDLGTRKIYRSGAFRRFSGYASEQIDSTLDWWFNKVHPDDRERVKNKLNGAVDSGVERWEDEYRFECADGSYKFLHDWYVSRYGNQCWELDAIDPVDLRQRVREQIETRLNLPSWEHAKQVEMAEVESMKSFHRAWESRLSQREGGAV